MTARYACATGVIVLAAILTSVALAQPANDGLAVGDRVADGAPGGLKGVIVKIGGPGDPSYYRGCYAIHFDYDARDPSRVEWTCTNTGSKVFKLAAGDVPVAAAAAPPVMPNPAAPVPAGPFLPAPIPARPMAMAQPVAAPHFAAPPDQAGQGSANVQSGNYECYGASGAMGGFNFTIAGLGAYTDIEGKAGTYTMAAGMMTFHGGAHDGQRATFFPGPNARNPSHITFENTLGGGLGISCDIKA